MTIYMLLNDEERERNDFKNSMRSDNSRISVKCLSDL